MYSFRAEIWEHAGPDPWHFITLPEEISDEIRAVTAYVGRRPFGTIPVNATIRETKWATALFPDPGRRTYLIPVKRTVRDAEQLTAEVAITIDLGIPVGQD